MRKNLRKKQKINCQGVRKLLDKINPSKSTGPDEICGKVLKELSCDISTTITYICQKSLETGKMPEEWKHANVCPVVNKGDKHNAIYYRPISLTCILCNILEHIIASSMMDNLKITKLHTTFNMDLEIQDHVTTPTTYKLIKL